jgi:hypothetical protein
MPKRRPLSEQQVADAHRLWAADASVDAIVVALGITRDVFRSRRHDQLADLPRRERAVNSGKRGVDPSPDEIALETAAFRAAWPDERFLPVDDSAACCGGRTAALVTRGERR